MKILNPICFFLIMSLFISGCFNYGFKYSIIEDDKRYYLKGHFYDNRLFHKSKAPIPSNFLVNKTADHIATKDDIQNSYPDEKIIEGFIVDYAKEIEIRILFLTYHGRRIPATENGIYKLEVRKQVDNLDDYVSHEEQGIFN